MYIAAREADQTILAEDVLKTAFAREGKLDQFKPEYNLWFGRGDSYDAGFIRFLAANNVTSTFYLGRFGSEAIPFAEVGAQKGCLQIAGTPNTWGAIFLVATCDYMMLGDELFAAAAIASESPVETAALIGSDALRLIVMAILAAGILLVNVGSSIIVDLLRG
jgi:hypothetical protein